MQKPKICALLNADVEVLLQLGTPLEESHDSEPENKNFYDGQTVLITLAPSVSAAYSLCRCACVDHDIVLTGNGDLLMRRVPNDLRAFAFEV